MSFVCTVNPNGGVVYRRIVEKPFSNHQLLERILSAENIRRAWKQVRANKGAPGIDGVTVEQFPDSYGLKYVQTFLKGVMPLLQF
jgi:RNA-directed DNA polymerase